MPSYRAPVRIKAWNFPLYTNKSQGEVIQVVRQYKFFDLSHSKKLVQLKTDGQPSIRSSISSLWGPKQLDSLCDLSLDLEIAPEKSVIKRAGGAVRCLCIVWRTFRSLFSLSSIKIQVRGFISKFTSGCGRAGTDRQFFYINGRPCSPVKVCASNSSRANQVYDSRLEDSKSF